MKTKTTTHTPGPWTVGDTVKQTQYGQKIYSVEIDGADGMTLAKVLPLTDKAQAEASARLIAAAPELLGALRNVLTLETAMIALEGAGGDEGSNDDEHDRSCDLTEELRGAIEIARAAIAKAEGGR
jgi:hypothetical protein